MYRSHFYSIKNNQKNIENEVFVVPDYSWFCFDNIGFPYYSKCLWYIHCLWSGQSWTKGIRWGKLRLYLKIDKNGTFAFYLTSTLMNEILRIYSYENRPVVLLQVGLNEECCGHIMTTEMMRESLHSPKPEKT